MRGALALAILAASLSGCTCNSGLAQKKFVCSTDPECGPGFACEGGECRDQGKACQDCTAAACSGAPCGPDGLICKDRLCQCSGNGGAVEVAEASCADGFDNDCDGLPDCLDPSCNLSACGPSGLKCSGTICKCSGNGGAPQVMETSCSDNHDNDCNGLVDCADSACNGLSCGANGRSCAGTTCTCSGNGGPAQATESSCDDGHDNDCDGLTDCADPNCNGQACGGLGKTCVGVTCTCPLDGGTSQAFETLCADGLDNDCDGLIDCADTTCEGRSCGVGCLCIGAVKAEIVCSGGLDEDADGLTDCADPDCAGRSCGTGCVCSGGVKVETICSDAADNDGDGLTDCADPDCCAGCPGSCEAICDDGLDNDGDGLTDCADPNCSGHTCGPNGKVCNGASCACSGNGGIPQAVETSCFDGVDNDCDGLIDCADPDCQARACTCELNCSDGIDNDCDGRIDCADPKCLHKSCSATAAASVCCSTQPNLLACKNLATDINNCGGCGLKCNTGRSCATVSVGAVASGHCDCTNPCPAGQTCTAGTCACATSTSCAAGEGCTQQEGLLTPGFCHYP